jgi:hypothetical protein
MNINKMENFLIIVQGDKGKRELDETHNQNRHLCGWSVMLEKKQLKGLTE